MHEQSIHRRTGRTTRMLLHVRENSRNACRYGRSTHWTMMRLRGVASSREMADRLEAIAAELARP